MKKHIIILACILFSYPVFSQETIVISQAQLLDSISSQNIDLLIARQDVRQAEIEIDKLKQSTLPDINLGYTASSTNNPLMAFGTKLNQEIVQASDFDPALLNDPAAIQNFNAQLNVRHSLINWEMSHFKEAAQFGVNALQYNTQRKKDYLLLMASQYYVDLQLAYRSLDVLESSLQLAMENKRIAQNSFDQGFLQKPDLLALDLRVNEIKNRIQFKGTEIKKISNALKVMYNKYELGDIKPADSLQILEKELLTSYDLSGRSDFKALESQIKAVDKEIAGQRAGSLPRVFVFGNYQINNDAVFNQPGDGYMMGLSLSWNLLGRKKNSATIESKNIEKLKINYQYESMKNQATLDIENVQYMMEDARVSIELARDAILQSRESLRIRSERFEQGMEKTSDLLEAEKNLDLAQMNYYKAIANYNKAFHYMNFLTKN